MTGRESKRIIVYVAALVVLGAAVAWGIAASGSC